MKNTTQAILLTLSLSTSAHFIYAAENYREEETNQSTQYTTLTLHNDTSQEFFPISENKNRLPSLQLSIKQIQAILLDFLELDIPIEEIQEFEYYKNAAEQGDPKAQLYLGVVYEDKASESICHDDKRNVFSDTETNLSETYKLMKDEAIKWIQTSADQGYANAQFYLGECYNGGDMVDFDPALALLWYKKAAKQLHAAALYAAAMHYEHGVGGPKDILKSIKYYKLSASQGNSDAQSYIEHSEKMGFFDDFLSYITGNTLENYLTTQKAAKEGRSA